MLKSNEIKQLDKEIIELEKLVSETMMENEIIKLNIKKKELLLKKYQLLDVKGYNQNTRGAYMKKRELDDILSNHYSNNKQVKF